MGFNPFKALTKPIKKILKSPAGIAAILALGVPAYAKYGSAGGWPGAKGMLGSGSKMAGLGDWLYGSTVEDPISGLARNAIKTPGLWGRSGIMGKSAIVGTGAAVAGAATMPEEDLPEELTDDSGQLQYLKNRALYEDEWADWLVDSGKAADKAEALEMVRSNPMFSEGGRVKAQGGLFAGQMPGRNPAMNQMRNPNMNPMGMNQGLGAPNLGSRSMGMTPGGGQMDPRMAQMMQGQRRPSRPIPKESEDTELIQLIKMLTSLGIPMEQLRGRTKEELVEMLVSVSGKMGGEQQGRPEVEEEVVEEEVVRAAHGGRIGMATGMSPGAAQARGLGAQHHGSVTSGGLHAGNVGGEGGVGFVPGIGIVKPPGAKKDGIISKLQNWQATSNLPKRTKFMDDLMYIPGMREKLLGQGIITEGEDDDYQNWQWAGDKPITDQSSLTQLRGLGYTGGIPTPSSGGGGGGGGGRGQTYSTAGAGTGITTAGTTGDDYYKFAEWDKWLMPGETDTQPLMPGGYKKEILANKGGRIGFVGGGDKGYWIKQYNDYLRMFPNSGLSLEEFKQQAIEDRNLQAQGGLTRTGYALGHPVIPSKDGPQLDMRDEGGYQPHGKAEKHDDVRALLAQGEFVMTSDAVKGMGGGDREVGAKKMYNLMHNMEAMA